MKRLKIGFEGYDMSTLSNDHEMWDIFTKKEEYRPPLVDLHGRFPYYISMDRCIGEPVVSKYLFDRGYTVEYPEGKRFAVCLTHDIDLVYPSSSYSLSRTVRSLRKGELKKAITIPLSYLNKGWNPFWNFKAIMALEEKYDAKSSFYFITADKDPNGINYRIEGLRDEIGHIADRGWEVGLHGGYFSYDSVKDIVEEKRRLESVLGKKVIGYRNHYLRFKVPDTWEHLAEAGIKYDTTFGYADCAGFRNGMCYPFKPYNITKSRTIDIVEIPLMIMDGTLFEYMRLDTAGAWQAVRSIIDVVEKYHGVVTILWHNNFMDGETLKFYEKILAYCSQKNAWMTSGEKIVQSNIFDGEFK